MRTLLLLAIVVGAVHCGKKWFGGGDDDDDVGRGRGPTYLIKAVDDGHGGWSRGGGGPGFLFRALGGGGPGPGWHPGGRGGTGRSYLITKIDDGDRSRRRGRRRSRGKKGWKG